MSELNAHDFGRAGIGIASTAYDKRIAELEHQVATRDESIHNLTALLDKAHKERRELNARAERTCRIVTDGHGWWECDECGGTIDWDSCDVNDPPACVYCPNCGAKVVGV